MKRVLVVSLAILFVIGGLFVFLNQSTFLRKSFSVKRPESQDTTGSSYAAAKSSDQSITNNSTSHATDSASHSISSSSPNVPPTQSNESSTSHSATSESTNTTSGQTTSTTQPIDKPTGPWVKKFEQELYKGYHATPSRYRYIGNGLWEVWVKEYNIGGGYPFVTVNQYTGNFHG